MSTHDTLYIAEPKFSKKLRAALQAFDSYTPFPPIKKIGKTTGHPGRRGRQLLGTVSPVEIDIVKAWTDIEASEAESKIHARFSKTQLDGEYFWDGNGILVEDVDRFIRENYPTAREISQPIDSSTEAPLKSPQQGEQPYVSKIVARELKALNLDELKIPVRVDKKGLVATFRIGEYHLRLSARQGNNYSLTVFSETRSTEHALHDFIGSKRAGRSEEGKRKALISKQPLDSIIASIKVYKETFRK